jgi:pyridoxine 5-phosphate synthase
VILLGVNIDHCATLRQARYKGVSLVDPIVEPDVVALSLLAEKAGADGITVHLREDRRHIQDGDVTALKAKIKTRLNLEMACTQAMIDFALKLKPNSVCVVPESRQEITTEGGLDVVGGRERVKSCIDAMNLAGIKTSLFIDPEPEQIKLAAELNAPWIELHTGAYANAYYTHKRNFEFQRLVSAAKLAHSLGLIVNAGHGINYTNIAEVKTIPHVHELNIGHSIIARSLSYGISEAVSEMKRLMQP